MEVWIGASDTKNITHISFGRGRYCKATLYAHEHIIRDVKIGFFSEIDHRFLKIDFLSIILTSLL